MEGEQLCIICNPLTAPGSPPRVAQYWHSLPKGTELNS